MQVEPDFRVLLSHELQGRYLSLNFFFVLKITMMMFRLMQIMVCLPEPLLSLPMVLVER